MKTTQTSIRELINGIGCHDKAERERATAAAAKRRLMQDQLVSRLKRGETSGDSAIDFVACCCAHDAPANQEIILGKLHGIHQSIARHQDQPALVVVTDTRRVGNGGCFGGSTTEIRRSYLMGMINGPGIVLDIEHDAWKLPTASHVSLSSPAMPVFKYDGAMSPTAHELFGWYGLGPDHITVEFLFGSPSIDAHFVSNHAPRDLWKLARALELPMEMFKETHDQILEGA